MSWNTGGLRTGFRVFGWFESPIYWVIPAHNHQPIGVEHGRTHAATAHVSTQPYQSWIHQSYIIERASFQQLCRGRGRKWPITITWITGPAPVTNQPWSAINSLSYPIGSMYGIYANIWGILMVNVTIYSIHGSYGYYSQLILWFQVSSFITSNLNRSKCGIHEPSPNNLFDIPLFKWEVVTINTPPKLIWNPKKVTYPSSEKLTPELSFWAPWIVVGIPWWNFLGMDRGCELWLEV